ncbi:hypothetical protein PR002_g13062 [Phytophthora rubi]|nr:hypothetical protein PR002_g13062 [Phytophthora rubi]
MEEDIHGVYLSEAAKNALFFRSLTGHARDWYIANKDTLRSRSLETLGRRLKREFGNRLTRLQVCELVANEHKKSSETYHQFSLRLRAMAAATSPNGSETVESNNLALSGFLVNAWNRHTDALRMVVREDSDDPLREMDRAIRRLCALAEHHGALPVRSAQTFNTGKRKAPDSASRDLAPKAGKYNSSSDRKPNPGKITRKDYSNARCGECGEYGHTTGYHDTFVRRQQGAARAASSMVATMQQPVPTAPADSEEDDEQARTVVNEPI